MIDTILIMELNKSHENYAYQTESGSEIELRKKSLKIVSGSYDSTIGYGTLKITLQYAYSKTKLTRFGV